MKVFDTSALLAVFDTGIPGIVDQMLKLGHGLAVPALVLEEIRSPRALESVEDLVERGRVVVLEEADPGMMTYMQREFPGMGPGECDAILACRDGAYCILDDRRARKRASEMGVRYTGLLGLLCMLKERGIMSQEQWCKAMDALRKSGFYLPRGSGRHG